MEPLGVAMGSWSEEDERGMVQRSFDDEEAQLIMVRGITVGWVHLRPTSRSLELWQLFIAEEHRGRGLGTSVLRQLQLRAADVGLPILLAVLRNNPAKRLYARLGFEIHAEGPYHLFLWWSPGLR